jgi:hypothetical protein
MLIFDDISEWAKRLALHAWAHQARIPRDLETGDLTAFVARTPEASIVSCRPRVKDDM